MSTTRLAKPLRRRLGDLIAELAPEGLTIRRAGERGSKFISWPTLERIALRIRPTRKQAFAEASPIGWAPDPGSRVWLDRAFSRTAQGTVLSVKESLLGQMQAQVKQDDGLVDWWSVAKLRPAPERERESKPIT